MYQPDEARQGFASHCPFLSGTLWTFPWHITKHAKCETPAHDGDMTVARADTQRWHPHFSCKGKWAVCELGLGASYTDRSSRCLWSEPEVCAILSCQNAHKLNTLMLLFPSLTVPLVTLLRTVLYKPAKKSWDRNTFGHRAPEHNTSTNSINHHKNEESPDDWLRDMINVFVTCNMFACYNGVQEKQHHLLLHTKNKGHSIP